MYKESASESGRGEGWELDAQANSRTLAGSIANRCLPAPLATARPSCSTRRTSDAEGVEPTPRHETTQRSIATSASTAESAPARSTDGASTGAASSSAVSIGRRAAGARSAGGSSAAVPALACRASSKKRVPAAVASSPDRHSGLNWTRSRLVGSRVETSVGMRKLSGTEKMAVRRRASQRGSQTRREEQDEGREGGRTLGNVGAEPLLVLVSAQEELVISSSLDEAVEVGTECGDGELDRVEAVEVEEGHVRGEVVAQEGDVGVAQGERHRGRRKSGLRGGRGAGGEGRVGGGSNGAARRLLGVVLGDCATRSTGGLRLCFALAARQLGLDGADELIEATTKQSLAVVGGGLRRLCVGRGRLAADRRVHLVVVVLLGVLGRVALDELGRSTCRSSGGVALEMGRALFGAPLLAHAEQAVAQAGEAVVVVVRGEMRTRRGAAALSSSSAPRTACAATGDHVLDPAS